IAATPCATFAGRKSTDRRGDSWLKRIAELACKPYFLLYAAARKLPYAFAAPYGESGRNGVDSDCGVSTGTPNTSADDAWKNLIEGSSARIASSSTVTPTVPSRATSTGSSHERGTNDGAARLYTSRGAASRNASRTASLSSKSTSPRSSATTS